MSDRIADFLFDYVIPALLVIVALAVVALIGLAIYVPAATEAERPCSDFADTSARNLPARCVAYWEQQR